MEKGFARFVPNLCGTFFAVSQRMVEKRKRTFKKKLIIIGIALGLFLALAWVALPIATQWALNRQLKSMPGYRGHVGRIGLHHLFRGAYAIEDIKIEKIEGGIAEPFFSAQRVDLGVQWSELFRGHIVGEVDLLSPQVTLLQRKNQKKVEEKKSIPPKNPLVDLPVKINRFTIKDGEVHFITTDTKPHVNIFLKNLQVDARNLFNTREKNERYFSTVKVTANTSAGGTVTLNAKANPLTKPLPEFFVKLEVEKVNLPALNDFLTVYGGFDVHRGRLDFYFEMESTPTHYKGYAKPLLTDVDVLDWEKDAKKKSFLQLVWKVVVGAVGSIFTNQPKDQIATKAPFEGSWKKTDVDVFSAVSNLIVNAFVQAITPGFDSNKSAK